MASWSELLDEHGKNKDPNWFARRLQEQLDKIEKLRKPESVIFYASSFLQKPRVGESSTIAREDINGFMNALYGASTDKGLTLILHTPGGDPNAVESIVEYLHSKFSYIEVIVPYLAMSGGAMISLASNLLVLGRQSQLGPIDPQIAIGSKTHSARAIREGFRQARENIKSDIKLAHLWAPILQNMGPSLIVEADKALSYSKELVINWLTKRMFSDNDDERKKKIVNDIGAYFNAEETEHGSIHTHGQRIGIQKLQDLRMQVEALEKDQNLQTEVLTAYHLMTLVFETTASAKFITSNNGKMWTKQHLSQVIEAVPAHS